MTVHPGMNASVTTLRPGKSALLLQGLPAWVIPASVGVIALIARLGSVLAAGGLHALLGYDEGVYMGAATALVHGLIPYRDFTLVHPPGSTILLAPFALLARATSEPTGWAAARVAVMLIGAANAAMITVIGRRVSLVAGITAGLLDALWGPVVHVERTTMLEAFVLAGLVIALACLRRPDERVARVVIAGGALGLGTSVKLWEIVPAVVILGWLLLHRAWRNAGILVLAGLVAFAAVVTPFLVITGRRMLELVVLAQLDRGSGGTRRIDRPLRMLGLDGVTSAHPPALVGIGALVLGVLLVLAIVVARRRAVARLWAALLVAQAAVLLLVPVYFAGYSSFIGPALILVLGAGVDIAVHDPPVGVRRVSGLVAGALAILIGIVGVMGVLRDPPAIRRTDPRVAALVAAAPCVASDSTGVLLMYDALGRGIDAGCPRPLIDVDGTIYAVEPSNPEHRSSSLRRQRSLPYQRALRAAFDPAGIVLIHRARADGLDRVTRGLLRAKGAVLSTPGLRVFGSAGTEPSS